ncbi:MAG TPA: hypothetical protein ENI20_03175, partial [Bacteroides sp.]|nr:hypothetical protein [Bacteroides sp.]
AIEEAKEDKITVFGAFPADGFFGSGEFNRFDGILAMYHDQGLIPFITLVQDEGVNYTAGLPVIRTSPACGLSPSTAILGFRMPKSRFRELSSILIFWPISSLVRCPGTSATGI